MLPHNPYDLSRHSPPPQALSTVSCTIFDSNRFLALDTLAQKQSGRPFGYDPLKSTIDVVDPKVNINLFKSIYGVNQPPYVKSFITYDLLCRYVGHNGPLAKFIKRRDSTEPIFAEDLLAIFIFSFVHTVRIDGSLQHVPNSLIHKAIVHTTTGGIIDESSWATIAYIDPAENLPKDEILKTLAYTYGQVTPPLRNYDLAVNKRLVDNPLGCPITDNPRYTRARR